MRIQMRGVCKSFLNAAVLKDVDFDLESGEVHALMGENGAGKSTLMKTLMGVYAKDSGVILIDGRQVNFFHPKQVKGIDDLVNKGIHVLIVNPVDSAAVAPAVRDVIDRGIKVITVDRYVDEAEIDIDTYIGTDKVIAANKAGKYFALIAGQDAVIAVLEGIPSTSSNLDRMEGYRQAFDEAGFRIAVTQTANYNRAEGLIVTENILQPNPDITAIIAMNDEMALGAIEAVRSKGKKPGEDIIVTGFDASHDAQAVVLAGEMVYTVEQKPVLIGETAVEAARSYLDGASVPSVIPVDVEIFAKQQPLKNSKMRIVLQDLGDNRPGCRTSPMNGARRAVRLDGVPADALLDAVMRFFPLDNYVEKPVTLTKPRHGEAVPEIWSKFDVILRKWDSEKAYSEFRLLERTEFYEYAKSACAVVQTVTAARYACVALRKGVI